MDSKASVPLYATEEAPLPAETSQQHHHPPVKVSLSRSPGIRAPPFYFDIENDEDNVGDKKSNGSSVSSRSTEGSYESEGFVSGEDEFETASERPFTADPDEEAIEVAVEGEGAGISFVRGGQVEEVTVPFVQSALGSSSFSPPKTVMPIAKPSREDDDVEDEGLVSEVEDDGVSGFTRVPSSEELQGSGGMVETPTPKVKVLGDEGGEEDESSLGRDSAPSEGLTSGFVQSGLGRDGVPEPLGVAGNDSETIEEGNGTENPKPEAGVLDSAEKEPTGEAISVSDELGEDQVPISTNSCVEDSAASEQDNLPESAKLNEDANPAGQGSPVPEKQELEGTELKDILEENKNDALGGSYTVEVHSSIEGEFSVDSKQNSKVIAKNSSLDGEADQSAPVIEESVDSNFIKADNTNSVTGGDLVVETRQPVLLGSESGVVGDKEENDASEAKIVEQPAGPESGVVGDKEENEASETEVVERLLDSESCVDGHTEEYKASETEGVERLLGSESGVVGDNGDYKASKTDKVEQPAEKSVRLGTGSDQSSHVVDEPILSKLIEADTSVAKIEEVNAVEHEAATNPVHEAKELGSLEPITNKARVVEVDVLDTGSTSVDTIMAVSADVHEGERDGAGAGADESICLDEDENTGISELESEQQTAASGADADESTLDSAINGVESESSGNTDGRDKIQSVDSTINSTGPVAEESKHLENGDASIAAQGYELEDGISSKLNKPQSMVPVSILDPEIKQEAEVQDLEGGDDDEGPVSDEEAEGVMFGSSEAAKRIMELVQGTGTGSHFSSESFLDHSQRIDGQIATDSDEVVETDEESDGKELFDSAALAALLKAATNAGSDGGSITITSSDGSRLFSVERPAGLGSSIRSLKPDSRPNRPSIFTPSGLTAEGESEDNLSEEEKKKLEQLQLIRVKFLRLVQRLGHSPEDSIVSQVLYRMVLAAGRRTGQVFNLEAAKTTAMQMEAEGKDDLIFSLNILVLGKTGVGKSATINSIFGEKMSVIDAFEPATTTVKEIVRSVDGVKIRIIDTPGLRPSVMEQSFNRKVLSSIKKFTKKCPPDIVLYVDRLDTQTRDLNDLPLLRSITSSLGSSIWRSAIVTLTHAASAPPDGPSGSPLSYEVFVAQRSHVVQQCIGQAVGDLRLMNPSLMNPVSLVENHPACRKNREGQRVLPNGQSWRPQLLLLCYSMKILSEVSSLSKPQDPFDQRKLFGFRIRSPPLPYLLSSLLQSRAHPKLSADQGGENGDSDVDLGDLSDSDQEEEEDEYDQLPPFKPLRKAQVANLSKEQRKAYFDEYDYRVKLLQKKQWKEEVKRMKEMKKGKASDDDYGYMGEDVDQENGSPSAVPVPLPDMVLPPSFDGDNPAYRYRFLEPTSQLLARPVLDTHGWDHDSGYDGVSLEQNLAIAGQFPAGVAVQITKDKKEFNIHLDSSVSAKHGENGSTLAGFDIQTIGKQLAYILRGETKFKNMKKNKTTAGISVTLLGENVATGLKIEDQIAIGKRLVLVGSTGAVRSQGDVAYGANLEARLREKDFPIGQDQSTLGLSLMKWRGDLALGANLQSQFSVGRNSKMAVRVGLNNKLSGQITVRTSTSEQLQIALMGILPIATAIFRTIWPANETYSAY